MAGNIIDEFIAIINWRVDDTDLRAFHQQANNLGQSLKGIGGALAGIGGALTGALTVPIVGFGVASLKAASDLENLLTKFDTLLGNHEKAVAMVDDIKAMGAATPYEANDLANATATMLSFGAAQEKVLPTMAQVGDIALGNKDRFASLSLQVAKMTSLGRLQGDMLNSMVDAGFNPLNTIAKKTGKTMQELTKELERGKISAEMVFDAMRTETSKGGKFFEGMVKASVTLSGRLSTLKDDFTQLLAVVGTEFLDMAKSLVVSLDSAIKFVTMMVGLFQKLPQPVKMALVEIAGIVAALGPILVVIGGVLAFIGMIAQGFAVLAANAAVVEGIIAAIGVAFSEVILPILAIVAAVAAFVSIFAVLKNDFDVWKAGGKSALGEVWQKLEDLKNKFLEFVRPIKEFFGVVFGALVSAAMVYFKIWKAYIGFLIAIFRVLYSVFEKVFGPFIMAALKTAWGMFKALGEIVGVIAEKFMGLVGETTTFFENLMNGILAIWNSEPMKWLRNRIGAVAEFGYTGNWNGGGGGTGGAQAAGTETRFFMPGAGGGGATVNAGGIQLNFGNTTATPAAISTAVNHGIVKASRMIEKQNGGRK